MKNLILPLLSIVLLSACSVQSETWVNKAGRAEIHEDQFTDTFETAKLNKGMLHAIADHYDRFGNGKMNIVISYDSHSKVNTRQQAQQSLEYIKNGLSKNGITDIEGALSEMRGSGDVSTTLISFPALTAAAPKGCGMMPGYEDPSADIPNDTNIKPPYGYGCTVETLLAKQVARPSDLMGRSGFETGSDGRRTERVLSTRGYYSDKEFPELTGETASEK